jgi:hypothetical protein
MENSNDKKFTMTCDHQMAVDGVILHEEQSQKTLENEDQDQSKKVEIFHKKSIGDSYYAVKVIITDGVPGEKEIDTNMDEDELQEFQEKWNSLKHSYLDDSDDDN